MNKTKKYAMPIISVVGIAVILYILSLAVNSETLLPSPIVVIEEFLDLLTKKVFYKEVAFDVLRTIYSFIIALVFAVILAVLSGTNESIERLFYPLIAIIRAVPTIAIILWCLIIFKSDKSPVAISFIVMFPMLYGALFSAISSRDKKLDEMAKIYGIKRKDYIFKIIVPDVADRSFNQVCSLFSFNVKLIVAGEALSYTKLSLGRELQLANANIETAKLLALTVAVILLSVLAEVLLKAIGKLVKGGIYGYNRKRIIEKLR